MSTWRVANSLVRLRDQINNKYPNRDKASDGTIGDAAHQAVASDHNPNSAGVVCALDITHSPTTGFDAHALADRLLATRHPDLKYLISNGRIAGDWTGWKWVPYSGTRDPHVNHIHVSVGRGDDGKSTQPYDDTNDWAVNQSSNSGRKSNDQIATEVIAGDWGNGTERVRKLVSAGYDAGAIQGIVNARLANKNASRETNEQVADEVLAGKWGNGDERRNRLRAAGYDYDAVQFIVNSKMSAKLDRKSNNEIATEVIAGDWGNGEDRKKRLAAAGYDYNTIQTIVNRRV